MRPGQSVQRRFARRLIGFPHVQDVTHTRSGFWGRFRGGLLVASGSGEMVSGFKNHLGALNERLSCFLTVLDNSATLKAAEPPDSHHVRLLDEACLDNSRSTR